MDWTNEVKLGITATLAALTAIWGWFGWLVILWVLCMTLDYLTGTAVACKTGTWSSSAARNGIFSKLGSIIVVLVTALADLGLWLVFHYTEHFPFAYRVLLCPIVLSWSVLTEMGSILENAGQLGAPLPGFLVRWVAVLRRQVDAAGDGAVNRRDM